RYPCARAGVKDDGVATGHAAGVDVGKVIERGHRCRPTNTERADKSRLRTSADAGDLHGVHSDTLPAVACEPVAMRIVVVSPSLTHRIPMHNHHCVPLCGSLFTSIVPPSANHCAVSAPVSELSDQKNRMLPGVGVPGIVAFPVPVIGLCCTG